MASDFALCLRRFLTAYLAGLRGCSPNTVASYRDTFKLLVVFFRDDRSIPPEKLTLELIDAAAIVGFLDWLEGVRGNSVSTRNQRLAAIASFFRWMQSEDPARMACCQDILAIPAKRQPQVAVNHLSVEQTRLLLAQPNRSTGGDGVTRPCSPPSTTPQQGCKSSPTSASATSGPSLRPWRP